MSFERIAKNIFIRKKFIPLSKQNNLYNLKKEKIEFLNEDILLIKGKGKYRITNSFLKPFESFIDYDIKYKIKLIIPKNKIYIIFKNKLYNCYCKLFFKNNNICVKKIILHTIFFVPSFIKKKIEEIVKETLLDEYNNLFYQLR
tara:strand:- start:3896 stop:4327 length:432 start_codon:yes stop_codon:yes gene_type:complete